MPLNFGEDNYDLGVNRELDNPDRIVSKADPLKIDLKDEEFANVTDKLISDSRNFFKKRHVYERRKINEEYVLGRQIQALEDKNKLKPHQARYLDNVIYEAEGTRKPVALSRVPDLIVKPGNEGEESKENADKLTEVVNNRMRKRESRTVLGKAYKHRPIYFIGVIKYRWDSEKGKLGDYCFESVHPDNIDVDHTASSNNVDDMSWLAHHYELSIKEIIMRWPKKKSKLLEELGFDISKEPGEKMLASKLKITEVWFTWYKEKKTEGEESKWQKIEGVAWKYKKLVFDKIKNPNWDWEGEEILFTYDNETKEKRKVEEDEVRQSMMQGVPIPGLTTDKVFNNYFQNPKKPFILVGYDQMGTQPYDETSRIEQGRYLQDNVNKRGSQITDIANHAYGTDIFSTESGMDAEDVGDVDRGDPKQSLLVRGKVNEVWSQIPGVQPSAALFQDQEINRNRLFSSMGVNSALRGVREGPDPATKTQLFKESDFTRIDDEVEDTVNYAAEKMAAASLQMIKLRYTEEHFERILGKDGITVFKSLSRDLVEDGMEVEVTASSVDKLRRRQEALEMARLKMIDPLTFYEDREASDPEKRAERVMKFLLDPALYLQNVVLGRDTAGMAEALNQGQPGQQAQPGQQGGQQQAVMDIAQIQEGQSPAVPEQIDAGYLDTLNNFLQSPEFQQLPPEIQALAADFARQVMEKAKQAGGQQPPAQQIGGGVV